VCYQANGTWESVSAGWKKGLHTVSLEIHVSRANLPKAIKQVSPYNELIADLLLSNPRLNDTIDTIVMPIQYSFGYLDWGASRDAHLGYRFNVTMKIQSALGG
jgi:hypothetical protein